MKDEKLAGLIDALLNDFKRKSIRNLIETVEEVTRSECEKSVGMSSNVMFSVAEHGMKLVEDTKREECIRITEEVKKKWSDEYSGTLNIDAYDDVKRFKEDVLKIIGGKDASNNDESGM